MIAGKLQSILFERLPVWTRRAAVTLLLLAAVVVCLYRIGARSMWLDELHHRDIGRGGISYVMNCPILSVQPAHGYYIINLLCEYITGDMDVGNRLPQAVSAILIVLLTYLLGKHLFGTGAGLLAAAAVLSNDMFVRYAQENRFYQMGSFGFLWVFYTYVRFLETRDWKRGLWFVLAASFALRTHSYGMLVVGAAAACAALLMPLSYVCKEHSPYDVRRPMIIGLVIAGACITLLWLPYPFRVLNYLSSSKTEQAFDAFFKEPFPLSVGAILNYMFTEFYRVPSTLVPWFKWLLLSAMVGSLVFRRGRFFILLIFFLAATVPALHALNNARAAVMPKRFLYFMPVLAIWAAGGCSMVIEALRHIILYVARRSRFKVVHEWFRGCALAVTVFLWVFFITKLAWPTLQPSIYAISQWYYTPYRVVYREIATLVNVHARPGDVFWWYPPRNDAWLCDRYLPEYATVRPEPREFNQIHHRLMQPYLTADAAVWWVGVTPGQAGVPAAAYIEIPVAQSFLYVTRTAYTNAAVRLRDAATLWRTALSVSQYPEIEAMSRLVAVHTNMGDVKAADTLVRWMQSRFPRSYEAATYASAYWRTKMDFQREHDAFQAFAVRHFWMPQFRRQLDQRQRELGRLAGSTSRWARLAYFVLRDKAERAERIAATYERQADLANALAWYERAVRAFKKKSNADRMTLRALAGHKLACARAAGEPVQELYSWLQAFWINLDYQRMYEFTNIAEKIIATYSNDVRCIIRMKIDQRYSLLPVFLEWYASTNRHEQLHSLSRQIEKHVTAETFPLYAYLFDIAKPTASVLRVIAPERLEGIGFDLSETWDGALGWFSRFYARNGTLADAVGFWDQVAARRQNFAAPAAINQAMLEFDAGAITQLLGRIERFKGEFRSTPWMRDRAVSILTRVNHPDAQVLLTYMEETQKQ